MRKSYDAFEAREKICPICGKRFYPPDVAAWVYKKRNQFNVNTFFCSWGCFRKEEESHGRNKKQ